MPSGYPNSKQVSQVQGQNLIDDPMIFTTLEIKRRFPHQIEQIRQPTAYCQACCSSGLSQPNDVLLTCSICESSIHKSHYGHEIYGKSTTMAHYTSQVHNLEEWKCQRCRYLIENSFFTNPNENAKQLEHQSLSNSSLYKQKLVRCEFCPSIKGIIKKVYLENTSPGHQNHYHQNSTHHATSKKEHWIHPECTTWSFPFVYQRNKKRTSYFKQIPLTPTGKFWSRIEKEPTSKCEMCKDSYGYKIKCAFYSCERFYHITCAKKLGIVRDLESMKFEKSEEYCPPYCEKHLENYVLDFSNRIKLHTEKGEGERAAHWTAVHYSYQIQLLNLRNAAKRSQQEQELNKRLCQQSLSMNEESSMSLSISSQSLMKQQSEEELQGNDEQMQLEEKIQEQGVSKDRTDEKAVLGSANQFALSSLGKDDNANPALSQGSSSDLLAYLENDVEIDELEGVIQKRKLQAKERQQQGIFKKGAQKNFSRRSKHQTSKENTQNYQDKFLCSQQDLGKGVRASLPRSQNDFESDSIISRNKRVSALKNVGTKRNQSRKKQSSSQSPYVPEDSPENVSDSSPQSKQQKQEEGFERKLETRSNRHQSRSHLVIQKIENVSFKGSVKSSYSSKDIEMQDEQSQSEFNPEEEYEEGSVQSELENQHLRKRYAKEPRIKKDAKPLFETTKMSQRPLVNLQIEIIPGISGPLIEARNQESGRTNTDQVSSHLKVSHRQSVSEYFPQNLKFQDRPSEKELEKPGDYFEQVDPQEKQAEGHQLLDKDEQLQISLEYKHQSPNVEPSSIPPLSDKNVTDPIVQKNSFRIEEERSQLQQQQIDSLIEQNQLIDAKRSPSSSERMEEQ